MRSSSKRFIWIDLAHVHTCKKTKNTVCYALAVSCALELKNLSYVLFIKYFVAKHDYDSDVGIDESVLLPQLRQQALLIPWKENNI